MIYEFEILKDQDVIDINIDDDNYFDTSLHEFWDWIKTNKLNHWCYDYYNPSEYDGHGQESGKYNLEEYLEQPYDVIKEHLTNYLLTPKFKKHF